MQPSIARLARIMPRSALSEVPRARLFGLPPPGAAQAATLIEVLQARKAAAGDSYPANIRLEAPIDKASMKHVVNRERRVLKNLMRER
jgi:hypothetical protein